MPHGVGHHGGGGGGWSGGGGGGWSGGGGHRHHHSGLNHHTLGRHHHYHGTPYYYGTGRRRGFISLSTFGVFVFLLVVILSSTLHSTGSVNGNTAKVYASRDNAIVSFSHRFCQSLSLRGGGSLTEDVRGTLYLLNKEPTRKTAKIEFSRTVSLEKSYEYWQFHLLPSSVISLTACYSASSGATFYMVKGADRFARWEDDLRPYDHKTTVKKCGSETTFTYKVPTEGQYYLIFDSPYVSTTVEVTFNISQVLYNITSDLVVANCSISLSSLDSCKVPVSLSSDTTGVLSLEPAGGTVIDWDTNIEPNVMCDARVWLYAVVCLAAVVAATAVLVAAIVAIYFYCRYRKRNAAINTTSAAIITGSNSDTRFSPPPSAPPVSDTSLLLAGGESMTKEDGSYDCKPFEPPPAYKP